LKDDSKILVLFVQNFKVSNLAMANVKKVNIAVTYSYANDLFSYINYNLKPEGGFLNKSSRLAASLSVTEFTTITATNLVTPCCDASLTYMLNRPVYVEHPSQT
jgi:hypothetical protein